MRINRDICRRVQCQWFAKGRLGARLSYYLRGGNRDIKQPDVPSTGLCAYACWSVVEGMFTDWEELPHECPYSAEMAVTQ